MTTTPTSAAKVANAYAAAVIGLRKEGQLERCREAKWIVENRRKLFMTDQSKLTADHAILQQQLRNPQTAGATVTVDFTVIVPAVPPDSPASHQPMRSAALGLAGGFIVRMALAFAVGRFDTWLRSHREVPGFWAGQ